MWCGRRYYFSECHAYTACDKSDRSYITQYHCGYFKLEYLWGYHKPGGVLNFHFGIGVRPKWGLKERSGTKNTGLRNWFFGENRGLKNWILAQFEALELKFYKIWGFGTESLRGYCTFEPYFWRLYAFSQKIKQLRTKYPMDLVRNVPRNSKFTVLLH